MFAARSLARSSNGLRAFSTSPVNKLARMQLIGRLADTPELTPTSTGRELVKYAIGVKAGPKNENGERQTSWFKVASFAEGPGRDLLLSLPKGSLIYIEADARMDSFQNQEGVQQTRLNLVQRQFETLSRPQNRPDDGDRSAAEDPSSGIGAS